MKRLFSILLAGITVMCSAMFISAEDSGEIDFGDIARFELGDVDMNSVVDSQDTIGLRKVILSLPSDHNKPAADLNYDGRINVTDLVRLKKKLAGIKPISLFEAQANELRASIVNAANTVQPSSTGRTVYVSSSGSESGRGTYSDPINYVAFIKRNPINGVEGWLSAGDVVLFKRGDVFRGPFMVEDGIYYGAYGEGEKPVIMGSSMNYNSAEWSVNGNIYSLSMGGNYDTGIIVFNDGENVGYKRSSLEEVTSEYDFYHDLDAGILYLCLNKAPAEYNSIEIGRNQKIINVPVGTTDVVIDNLSLKYTGAHAVYLMGETSDITVQNCEISYIGGSYIPGYGDGTTRYGNGVEIWQGCDNILVQNNWIYEIYDSGITHQGSGSYQALNITFRQNLIEYCGMGSIEYWMSYGSEEDKNYAQNVSYCDNIMRYAGYGFGGVQRPDKNATAHIQSGGGNQNNITNFTIKGNIFDLSTGDMLNIVSLDGTYPVLSSNIYAQTTGASLGIYNYTSGCSFDIFAENTLRYTFLESDPTVYWY